MDWLDLFYFLLGGLLFCGAKFCARDEWNDECTSLRQTKMVEGVAALGVVLHHVAQKTCGSWHPRQFIVHGLDVFVDMGYIFVAIFFFCSGLGLYKSFRSKQDYLKGFFRRRVLPMAVAFYLSEWIHLGIRLLMGQRMSAIDILGYLSGLRLANENAWFMVILPLFYLFFYLAFRFCRDERGAIALVFLGVILYAVGCAFVDHQSVWWIRGEWWYNSVILFPFGLLFGRHEAAFTRFFKKKYLFWLLLSFAAVFGALRLADLTVNQWAGYYGENWRDPLKVVHRLWSASAQGLVCLTVVFSCFLFLMKCRLGNRVLAWLGAMSMDLYLAHGVFVELFGFGFWNNRPSLHYIRSVPLFLLTVLACGVVAAILFRRLRLAVMGLIGAGPGGRGGLRRAAASVKSAAKKASQSKGARSALLAAVLLAAYALAQPLLTSPSDPLQRNVNGMLVRIPDGFICVRSDRDYSVWEYRLTDRKPGPLILNAAIRGKNAQFFNTAEEVLADCDWMDDRELYTNPQGVRMVRGYSAYSEGRELRYYVETPTVVFLMSMNTSEAYYDPGDCEAFMRQAADSVSPAV